ncbi:synaptic vesicle glycoprotein 2A-like [Amyelois transitella]|uniref:synaptic vesicle glycoprotein 2A-like n=1 Tax=Amyelois transitella TaxID=680683 RepID=UPI00299049E0|nr:synaptic vesicle glycoprotein 2A-like [Amyelois transitella]
MSKFEDAFELTGYGWFNHLVTFTSGLVLLYTMEESLGIGYIMTVAECDLNLTVMQKGLINSAAFIGILSTGIWWGYLSDQYGRKRVMLPALLTSCVISFSSTFSTNFISMFLLRLLTGCLVSASSATVFAYVGEMHDNTRRSTAIMYSSTAIAVTFIILPILGWIILSDTWSYNLGIITVTPWRVFMWTWLFPGLLAALILVFLPESPRFLLANKGPEEARDVLAQMYAKNLKKKKEEYPVKTISDAAKVATKHGFKVAFTNLAHLSKPPLRRCVLLSHTSMFMIFML